MFNAHYEDITSKNRKIVPASRQMTPIYTARNLPLHESNLHWRKKK